ncbi:hypothetical protein PHJA_002136300 [Phtheirospermum japonicum]|uniref:OVATE domain-containing protein n=1 Tax=Phtheirospermum japonicum TaxID=374723 RepID=A0A830CNW4_9LAMI|nr:hypothetical protein PHJA_002136300 [Phtheirospermum japonicum]
MLIKETIGKTKKLFHKTFKNLKKSLILVKYHEQPTNPTPNPIFPDGKKDNNNNSKSQDVDKNFYRSYSEKWDDAIEVKKKKTKDGQISSKAQQKTKRDDKISTRSISFADCRGLEAFKEDKNARKYYGKKPKASSFRGADALARKMKDLEMMDANDMDHVLDVEEVLHYYSRLNCPSYVEIVDKFFTDMHSDFNVPQPSRSGSMRKLGSASAHSSMRSLAPLKL